MSEYIIINETVPATNTLIVVYISLAVFITLKIIINLVKTRRKSCVSGK